MNKKIPALVLTGALACALAVPAFAADVSIMPISAPVSTGEVASLPDSVLYYGTVKEIGTNENGERTWLPIRSGSTAAGVPPATLLIFRWGRASMCSTAQWRPALCRLRPRPLRWCGMFPWTPAVPGTMRWKLSPGTMAA